MSFESVGLVGGTAPLSVTSLTPNDSDIPSTIKPAWGGAGIEPINPWNKYQKEQNDSSQLSFKDVMSEDLAKDLEIREQERLYQQIINENQRQQSTELKLESISDTSSDLLLAHMLQHDYNKEYDNHINREEKHLNKNSKLSISFNKYKLCTEMEEDYSDDEDNYELDDENRALDLFEERQRNDPVIPPCGYIRHNDRIVTKHDGNISGRKNAERIMNFPLCINTGDGGGFPMEISNHVFNKLQRTAQAESKRKQRIKDKSDKATTDKVLDPKTRLIVYKMVNNSILECVNGVISTGKESVVFHAQGGTFEEIELTEECAIKVFKTCLTDFKTRERYIRNDYRFKDRLSRNNNKKMIQLWCEKEFHNLHRLQKAGIPSPKPLLIRKHVLVMSFIGENQVAAPKLKQVRLSYADWCIAYEQVVEIMIKMFQACRLVHGDMSEFNILWYKDQCWVIDLGQAVEPQHPHGLSFLLRDCSNIVGFFRSKGLTELPTPLQLFEKVTGIKLPGNEEEAERLVEEYEMHQELWREGLKSHDNFDFLWREIQKEEKLAAAKCDEIDDELEADVQEELEEEPCIAEEESKITSKKKKFKKKKNKPSAAEHLISDVSAKLKIDERDTITQTSSSSCGNK